MLSSRLTQSLLSRSMLGKIGVDVSPTPFLARRFKSSSTEPKESWWTSATVRNEGENDNEDKKKEE